MNVSTFNPLTLLANIVAFNPLKGLKLTEDHYRCDRQFIRDGMAKQHTHAHISNNEMLFENYSNYYTPSQLSQMFEAMQANGSKLNNCAQGWICKS